MVSEASEAPAEDSQSRRQGPAWLPSFLSGDYFSHCTKHVSTKNERNHFCIDCGVDGPMCHLGLHNEHASHRTLQVRRASHMDAVRVHDIQKLADISAIQTYTINGAKIVFLLSRPQERVARAAMHWCRSCNRTLADACSFCSISCKLAMARSDPSVSLASPFSDNPVDRPHTAEVRSRPPTCCLENEPRLTAKRLQLPVKKRRIEMNRRSEPRQGRGVSDSDEDEGHMGTPRSPISVLVPASPQHSGNSHYCSSYGVESLAPRTPQKHNEVGVGQRRKGCPRRSPFV